MTRKKKKKENTATEENEEDKQTGERIITRRGLGGEVREGRRGMLGVGGEF